MTLRKNAILLTAAIIAVIAFIFCVPKAHSFEGAYVSGSFGGILPPINHLGEKITDIAGAGTGGLLIKEEWQTTRLVSPYFSIKAGYGKIRDKHYSGIEGSINKSRYRMKISKESRTEMLDSSDILTLRMRDVDLSCDFRQGYLLSKDMMIFAKLGMARNRLRMSLESNNKIKYAHATFDFPEHYKIEKTVYPVRIGFEIEKKFLEKFSLTADYTYTRIFRSFTLGGKNDTTTPGGRIQSTHSHKITVQEAKVSVGLKYYF